VIFISSIAQIIAADLVVYEAEEPVLERSEGLRGVARRNDEAKQSTTERSEQKSLIKNAPISVI
jgi:hypothetical protein